MKNTELTIGTKVKYNQVSLKNGETTSLESVVKGFYDGYVSLENGDKMFKQALTTIKTHTMTTKEQINQVVAELNKCLPNAQAKSCGYKVRVGRETYVSNRVSCITIVGKCHVENLEQHTSKAIDKYFSFGNDAIQHTMHHNIKLFFRD
tara:strand:+ start:150 stop:596 length:447 start_codon:yes stop_codon:yes gene_type:complete